MKVIFNIGFIFIIKRINMYKPAYADDAPNAIEMWNTWSDYIKEYNVLDINILNTTFKNISSGISRKFLIETYEV